MANSKRKPIHIDQQKPEDLESAEHSPVTPTRFSRRPPTPEDEYFEQQFLRKRVEAELPRGRPSGRTLETGASSTRFGRWIEKITGRLSKKMWRP